MGLFSRTPDSRVPLLEEQVSRLQSIIEEMDTRAFAQEAQIETLQRTNAGLAATASAVERLATMGANIQAGADSLALVAQAISESGKANASAISSLALATERRARAAQGQLELSKGAA